MKLFSCGDEGIRTLDTVSRIHTFQACSFNHSDTSPWKGCKNKSFHPYCPNKFKAFSVVLEITSALMQFLALAIASTI